MNFSTLLHQIVEEAKLEKKRGTVADYIPELKKVAPSYFGIALIDIEKQQYHAGDSTVKFSIQSISKVFMLAKAFELTGKKIWDRIDVEPSGDPFNQLSLLEMEKGIPRNPFINPGAIVVCDILLSELKNPKLEMLDFIRSLAKDSSIDFNPKVADSEKKHGFGNYAAANLIKSFNNLNNAVEDVLDLYFNLCSIEMNCLQLAKSFFPFFNAGKCFDNQYQIEPRRIKRINAIMLTCGFYDQAGEFAFEVGLPGKSGVGGGIVAVLHGKFAVATWSPGLNEKGNSLLGMSALEKLTTKIEYSIF